MPTPREVTALPRLSGSSRQAKLQVVLLTLFGVLIAPAIFAVVVLLMAEQQNAIANDERLDRAQSILGVFAASSKEAVDYTAHAPETYRSIVLAQDAYWFELKYGAVQYGQMPQDATLVVDGTGKVFYGSWLGERTEVVARREDRTALQPHVPRSRRRVDV